jgi:hypothetical protein
MISVNGQTFVIGETYTVWDRGSDKRMAIGKLLRVFKNAIELDCIELSGNVGPFGARQFLFSKYKIA